MTIYVPIVMYGLSLFYIVGCYGYLSVGRVLLLNCPVIEIRELKLKRMKKQNNKEKRKNCENEFLQF